MAYFDTLKQNIDLPYESINDILCNGYPNL